jgi:hypothetical protein
MSEGSHSFGRTTGSGMPSVPWKSSESKCIFRKAYPSVKKFTILTANYSLHKITVRPKPFRAPPSVNQPRIHDISFFLLPLYKITLSEAFKLRRQSPFTLMSAVSQAESGPAKPAANR